MSQVYLPGGKGACPITDIGQKLDKSQRALLTEGGEELPILKTVRGMSFEGNDYLVETFLEISDLKRAENAVQESERKYRQLFENTRDIIYKTDDTGRITFVNGATVQYLGYGNGEIIGRSYVELIREDHRKDTQEFYATQAQRRIPNTYREVPVIRKDREELWLAQNVQLLITDERIVGFQAVGRDITDRKQLEEEERYRERLQGVMEMAGALCHEVNQPLMSVSGLSDLLLMDVREEDPLYDNIKKIKKEVVRMGELTAKLMRITRYRTKGYLKGEIIDLDKALE